MIHFSVHANFVSAIDASLDTSASLSSRSFTNGPIILVSVALKISWSIITQGMRHSCFLFIVVKMIFLLDVVVGDDDGVDGSGFGADNSVLTVFLDGFESKDLREHGARAHVNHVINALGITPQKPDGTCRVFLPFGFSFLQKLQEWAHPAFFDYELPVAVAVAGQGDQLRGGVGAVLQGTRVEDGDLLPDEAEDRLVRRYRREPADVVSAAVSGGDPEEPGDVADGVLEEQGDLAERGAGVEGEDALHEGVAAALEGQGEGLVEDVFCFVDDAARGTLVEIGTRTSRLTQQRRQLLRLRLQLAAFLLEGAGFVGGFGYLVRQLDRLRQYLFHYITHRIQIEWALGLVVFVFVYFFNPK
ncbi:hypothetical protein HKD37_11G030768 [Glycine soja]